MAEVTIPYLPDVDMETAIRITLDDPEEKMKRLLILSLLILAGCSGYGAGLWYLETLSRWNRIGHSSDMWLVLTNTLGEHERVALIFGYADDFSACSEIALLYVEKHPLARYRCTAAN